MRLKAQHSLKEQVNSSITLPDKWGKELEEIYFRCMSYISDVFVSPAYLETGSLPKAYTFFDLEDEECSSNENQETPKDLLKSVLYIEPQQHVVATADGSLLGIQLISEWQNKVLLELQSQMQHQNYSRYNSVDIKGETRQAQNFTNLAILKKFLSL